MDDSAAVKWRPTSSCHCGRRALIAFGMLATKAAAGNTKERHRIVDRDGQGRQRRESHQHGMRRSRWRWEQECSIGTDTASSTKKRSTILLPRRRLVRWHWQGPGKQFEKMQYMPHLLLLPKLVRVKPHLLLLPNRTNWTFRLFVGWSYTMSVMARTLF